MHVSLYILYFIHLFCSLVLPGFIVSEIMAINHAKFGGPALPCDRLCYKTIHKWMVLVQDYCGPQCAAQHHIPSFKLQSKVYNGIKNRDLTMDLKA